MGDINLGTKLKNLDENVADAKMKVDEVSDVVADNGDYLKSKNLLNITLETTTLNGVTCTNNGDGTYTLNGTAGENAYFNFNEGKSFLSQYKGKTLRITGCPSGGSVDKYLFAIQGGEVDGIGKYDIGAGQNVTISENIDTFNTVFIRIFVKAGQILENIVFKPMIVDADLYPDTTYGDFVPYIKSNVELASDLSTLIETLKSKGVID